MTEQEKTTVLSFLQLAQDRVALYPNRIPFKAVTANIVINWLRALLENQEVV